MHDVGNTTWIKMPRRVGEMSGNFTVSGE